MNEYDEQNENVESNENVEPNEADGAVAEAADAADEVIELPEIVEATAGDEVPADATVEAPAAAAPGVADPHAAGTGRTQHLLAAHSASLTGSLTEWQ